MANINTDAVKDVSMLDEVIFILIMIKPPEDRLTNANGTRK